jgi:hypothetical protein
MQDRQGIGAEIGLRGRRNDAGEVLRGEDVNRAEQRLVDKSANR